MWKFYMIGTVMTIIIAATLSSACEGVTCPMLPVPLDSDVYVFIDRLATSGYVDLADKSLPLSRYEICEILDKARGKTKDETDRKKIQRYLDFFAPGNRKNPYLWSMRKENTTFEFDVTAAGGGTNYNTDSGSERVIDLDWRVGVWGQIGDYMAFGDDARSSMIWGPWRELPYTSNQTTPLEDEQISISAINAFAVFQVRDFRFEIGRDKVRWGPGFRDALMLSDYAPSMDMIKVVAPFKPFKFTYLVAALNDIEKKYLTAHRLEACLRPWLTIGVAETAISVKELRKSDLNPFLVYFITEEGGASDWNHNRVMSIDGQLRPIKGVRVWSELMVDDFQPSLGFWDPGTKLGFLAGCQIAAPLIPNSDITAEYAFVNQYAYTRTSTDEDYSPAKAYTHDGHSLGSSLGNDSERIYVRYRLFVNDLLTMRAVVDRVRKGEGRIDKPLEVGSRDDWEYLSGIRASTTKISGGGTFELIGRLSADIEIGYSQIKNKNNKEGKDSNEVFTRISGFYRF